MLPTRSRDLPGAILLGALAIASMGCTRTIALPPMTASATGSHDPGRFVWYDLLTDDRAGVVRFYSGLLGWSFEETADPRYTLVTFKGVPIAGIIDVAGLHDVDVSQWVASLSVADVDRAAAAVERAGGELHTEPRDVAERGRLAIVSDPQGALFALVRSSAGDPPAREPRAGDFFWTELWAGDAEGAIDFYKSLAGYERRDRTVAGEPYRLLELAGQARAGVIQNPVDEIRPHWLPYVLVDDARAAAAKVTSLGGSLLLAPHDDIRKGSVAIVTDPGGAALSLQAPVD